MKDFREVVKMRKIPASFLLRCELCNLEISNYDWHWGLVKMNEHVADKHSNEAQTLDREELLSRKPTIRLESY